MTMCRVAGEGGLEYVGIQDHPDQRRFLHAWMLMAAVLAKTERVCIFPGEANLRLCLPLGLAKAAASLDVLSVGRLRRMGAREICRAVALTRGDHRPVPETA